MPTVLIEAMAVGTPVIATNCPSGPQEILAGGKYGELVPVGDENAIAKAALPTSWYKMYNQLQYLRWRVTTRLKSYAFFIKIIAASNPPYEL